MLGGDLGIIFVVLALVWLLSQKKTVSVSPIVAGPTGGGPGSYECFDQREDDILVHCCRYKTKPTEEPTCKTTAEAAEFLKCCRDDQKPWGGLW